MAGANGSTARRSRLRWCTLATCASVEVARAKLDMASADVTSETACFVLTKRPCEHPICIRVRQVF